jgi:hypothetical protein
MGRQWTALLLALATALTATSAAAAASAGVGGVAEELVYTYLPVTPAQAREITTLLRSPGTVAVDVADSTGAVVDVAAALPVGTFYDLVTTPVRHWYILRGLVTDTVELAARPPHASGGLFHHTVAALYRSRVFSATARAVGRVTEPSNRTGRLAIVLTARAYGFAAEDGHLDLLRRAIDRDDPDAGPLLLALVDLVAKSYGRDAVRVVLR